MPPAGAWKAPDMSIKILCVGDVVGKPGRRMLADHLKVLIEQRGIDLVVCNGENASGGSGLTPQAFGKFRHYGVDVVTLGDHVYRKREITRVLETSDRCLIPANLSDAAVGPRWTIVPTKDGRARALVAVLVGQMFMASNNSPWAAAEKILQEASDEVKVRVFDFHAEASSEKIAMGWFLNGRASIVFGTHTHIPTADACILDGGTAYISDLGMTGPYGSVLGRRTDRVLHFLTTQMPTPFAIAEDDPRLYGVLVAVDEASGKATGIEPIVLRGYVQTEAEQPDED